MPPLNYKRLVLIFALLLFIASIWTFYPRYLAEKNKTEQLAKILSEKNPPSLGQRIKFFNCVSFGSLPDATCTPGAIFTDATPKKICVKGYSKSVRKVSQKLRKKIYAEYNTGYPQPHGAYEVDHLIPLSIGGSNNIANLWPQPAKPIPGFHEKDLVEIFLQQKVCDSQANLKTAQYEIAHDWLAIYKNIPSVELEKLKAKYRSWAK